MKARMLRRPCDSILEGLLARIESGSNPAPSATEFALHSLPEGVEQRLLGIVLMTLYQILHDRC